MNSAIIGRCICCYNNFLAWRCCWWSRESFLKLAPSTWPTPDWLIAQQRYFISADGLSAHRIFTRHLTHLLTVCRLNQGCTVEKNKEYSKRTHPHRDHHLVLHCSEEKRVLDKYESRSLLMQMVWEMGVCCHPVIVGHSMVRCFFSPLSSTLFICFELLWY